MRCDSLIPIVSQRWDKGAIIIINLYNSTMTKVVFPLNRWGNWGQKVTYLATDHKGGKSQGSHDPMQADLGTWDWNHYGDSGEFLQSLDQHQAWVGLWLQVFSEGAVQVFSEGAASGRKFNAHTSDYKVRKWGLLLAFLLMSSMTLHSPSLKEAKRWRGLFESEQWNK